MTQGVDPSLIDYGSDLSCVSDLNPHMGVVSGLRLVAEAIARRLQTPRGALVDDASYGYDLTDQLNSDLSASDLGVIGASVTAECRKDQRILNASTVVTFSTDPSRPGELDVTISLTTRAGPFSLQLAVSQVTVSILSIGT